MPRTDQKLIQVWLPAALADRFADQARQRAGSSTALLRQLVADAVDASDAIAPRGVGQGRQIAIRLRAAERAALAQEARRRRTTPTNWVRSLVLATIARQPQWTGEEVEELRRLYGELGRIGNNINQIARMVNAAVERGEQPAGQGDAVRDAVRTLSGEMDRIAELVIRNGRYWDAGFGVTQSAVRRRRHLA